MIVPKYVQDILRRSEFEFDWPTTDTRYGCGYTIRVHKASPYTRADTLRKELNRLCKWAHRECSYYLIETLYEPQGTRYDDQYAVITIWDPLMQKLEKYIPGVVECGASYIRP